MDWKMKKISSCEDDGSAIFYLLKICLHIRKLGCRQAIWQLP
jgi:hypothetical protein